MRLPWRRKALTGSPEIVEILAERTGNFFGGLAGSTIQGRINQAFMTAQSAGYAWMYSNSPSVRTVVDLIARNVGQLDLRLYEEVDESERQAAYDHPAAVSLRHPSATQTPDGFVRAVMSDYLVFLNAYALKFRNPQAQTLTIKPIPATRVQILGASLFDPDAYRITRLDGTQFDVAPQDVIHWRGWSPHDPRLGLSPLETLRDVIAEEAALQTAIVELAKSGLAGPSYIYRPLDAPEWSNGARKGFDEWLANQLKQVNRKPFTLEEGMEFRDLGVSPADAQMLEVRKWAITQVANEYGVPLGMLGLALGVGADTNASRSAFYSDTLPPYCEMFTRQLSLSVCQVEYGRDDLCFEFDLDEKMMGDERMKTLVSASGRPVMTTDEARQKLNLPPIDGGDALVTPLNVIVGDNPLPSPQVMPPQDPNGPAQDGSHRNEVPTPPKALEVKATLHPTRRADFNRQQRYIDEAKGLLERYYARQDRSLKAKATFDSQRWDRELADDLDKLISSIVDREGSIYVARLAGADFDMRQVQNYIKATAAGVAEALNAVTQRDIAELGTASDAIQRARGERAAVAATSIGARAAIFARMEAAKQAPSTELRMKTWVADTDRHAEVDGETVPIDEDFSIGFDPGSAPACACSLVIS